MKEESFAVEMEKEKQEAEEKRKLLDSCAGYRKEIDDFLRKKAYEELIEYFQTDGMKKIVSIDSDAAVFSIILSIYQMELAENAVHKILDGTDSMEEAEERYLGAKFLMWRLEFGDEKQELLEFIKEHQVSVPFLKYLIHTSAFEKANTAFELAVLLKENSCLAQSFGMLNYVNELSPGEEMVFCEMADICIQLGQYESAAACIGRIENPSEMLVEYQKKWGI